MAMDLDSMLSSDLHTNLKCFLCKNYLSCPPIRLTVNNKSICGRCPPPSKKCVRNLAYEVLSQYVDFPCRYKSEGCNKKMTSKEMGQHEEVCPYKIIKCPTAHLTKCLWQGSRLDVLQHCLDTHNEDFLKNNEFEIDCSYTEEFEHFLEHNQTLFIFSRKFDSTSNFFYWSVRYFEDEINLITYPYLLTLKNGTTTLSDASQVVPYSDTSYNRVLLDSVKMWDHNRSKLLGRIDLDVLAYGAISTTTVNYEAVLSMLKCTICSAYVFPPIYFSEEKMIKCSCCAKECVNELRNYNLENVVNLLIFPCKYRRNGCRLMLKPKQMELHQIDCDYRDKLCFFTD